MASEPLKNNVGLPPRTFLYTLDQVATLVSVKQARLEQKYIWYEQRTPGKKPRDMLSAHNIAPDDARPDWRVSEQELIRWMRVNGFRYYDRAWLK